MLRGSADRQYHAHGVGAADRERERALERACYAYPPEAQAAMDELLTLEARASSQLHRLGFFQALALVRAPVSYTHLDVYKRQPS